MAVSSTLKNVSRVTNFKDNTSELAEEQRLRELSSYQVLPIEKDDDLDSLVRLAARICDSPISMINLVADDRQWTQASVGIEITDLPRDVAFCSHTIQADHRMIVPDTLEDDRFRDSPLVVKDPNFRFYAGYNIKGSGGHNIGSLCVIDRKPRELTDHQLESLQILAGEVEARLNLKKKNRELEKKATFLRNSADLMFIINPDLFQITDLNAEMDQLLGYQPGELKGKPLATLGPGTEFFDQLNEWAQQDAASGRRFTHQTQVRCKNGESLWFEIVISEKERLWYATGRNIQEVKEVEETHRETLKVLQTAQRIADIGHWEWYPQDDRLVWSKEMHNMIGTSHETYTPSVAEFLTMVPEEDRCIVEKAVAKVVGGGTMDPFEHRCMTKSGDTIHVIERGEAVRNELGAVVKVSGILQNITRQKETEKKIRESLLEKEMMLAEIHHRVKNNLAMISGIMQLEMSTLDSEVELTSIQSVLTRIKSLALVHENLYQSDSFSRVPFGDLLKDLVSIAVSSGSAGKDRLDIDIDATRVDLNINQAIPFALAINQLIYGSINDDEHPVSINLSENRGNVTLKIQTSGKSCFTLTESDDDADDIGLQLFRSLLNQFGGTYTIDNKTDRAMISLVFAKTNGKGSSDGQFT
ncbi:histidine kinase dimerization/phosphoacceptor domain -containing protein [Rhodohalobacter sp. 8-1]|uniref:histidine kinase dimerization/phosphoacceptor domain -containing protein n=1 Tax=Rhodohalobacter sp. 8-1 TaxID=3131972 RepID=UPI0030EF0A9A